MKKIKKDTLLKISILVIAVASILLIFFPDLTKYPYSYENINEKKQMVEDNNLTMLDKERELLNQQKSLEAAKQDEEQVYNEALELKRNINPEDFEFDISSFLISMEQQALKDKVSLKIDYGAITHSNGGSESPNPADVQPSKGNQGPNNQENPKDEARENDGNKGGPETNAKDSEDKDAKSKNEESEESGFSADEITSNMVSVDGLNVTAIPIYIEGTYYNVRSYIQYLDKIGMIEPSSVELNSEGKIIKGKVLLNVFHGEVL